LGTKTATSEYEYLLEDPDFKRWFQNIRRGSVATGYEWLRRMGLVHKKFGKSPSQIASMNPKQATGFLLDIVGTLEDEGKNGGYIANIVKPVKSWLDFNGKTIQQRIKIPGRGELAKVGQERTPTPEELAKIFRASDLQKKTACSLVAFAGLRLEVLGDYLGNDGLELRDLPELAIRKSRVEFKEIPTTIMVRKNLSKTSNQYLTFLCDEGCEYLSEYLEWRLSRGEKLTAQTAIITPKRRDLVGEHIRTLNIGDMMRKPIRDAGFQWRPYVLRRYFDTRMMMAESDDLVMRDWRVFWMGHRGDIEHTYTLNKTLTQDVINRMRASYAKAAERHLTTRPKEQLSEDMVKATVNKQFLHMTGYTEEEIDKLGDLSQLSEQQMQELLQRKSMRALRLNGNGRQKIVPMEELRKCILEGWEYVTSLPTNEAVVTLRPFK
jgi:PAS domain-containing protein